MTSTVGTSCSEALAILKAVEYFTDEHEGMMLSLYWSQLHVPLFLFW